jgi:glutamate-1-semialdehyde 2,1-aminomutase
MIATARVTSLTKSQLAMNEARKSIASGLSSFARFRNNQVVFAKAEGAYLWDIDGNRYIDCVCAHGPVFLGHANPRVNAAVKSSLDNGAHFGGPHLSETVLAEMVLRVLPWADKIAYMNTGSEAIHLALRIAKSHTGRAKVLKFDGHYHGWIDPLFVNAPRVQPAEPRLQTSNFGFESGSLVAQQTNVPGQAEFSDVLVATWGDLEAFSNIMDAAGSEIAAVIMEPLATNFGTFKPPQGYLEELITISRAHGALVIFDEIVTGFRIAPGGAAELLGLQPDLATYGKAVASGMHLALVAGTSSVMETVADGRVFTVGTFSGAPAAVAAAIATLDEIAAEGNGLYARMDSLGKRLASGIIAAGDDLGLPVNVNQLGSLLQMVIGSVSTMKSIDGVNESNKVLVADICERMILLGVYMSRKGIMYLNASHSDADIDVVIETFHTAAESAMREQRREHHSPAGQ